MTQKEYELACENEKLKKKIKELENKNKDLEAEKKTFKLKLKILSEQLDSANKKNKTTYYKSKYEIALQDIQVLKAQYKKQLQNKDDYITRLKAQLQKDSSNSSKPSSTNGFKKVVHNFREKTEKKQGAQPGHTFHSAEYIEEPSEIIKIKKKRKCECGGKIEYTEEMIKRQLVEIQIEYKVIEYQGKRGKCIKCGKIHNPQFPKGINNNVQYGNSVKGLSLILSEYGNISVDKVQEIIGLITNSKGPSSGSIMNWKKDIYKKMQPIREEIKEEMLKAPIINNDETPYKLNGKQRYAIGAFTDKLSAIECNGGREKKAFEKMNVLPRYANTLMGDHYVVNESFQGEKAFCNAHTIRAAKGVLEQREESTAREYINFMNALKKEVEETSNNMLTEQRYEEIRKEYIGILNKWKKEFEEFMKGRNAKYYADERRLIKLLIKNVEGHLLFAKKDYVMFTNNLAERGLRPLKTKVKVIGGFREQKYSDGYCCTMSIIQTAQKQNLNPCKILNKIINGERKIFDFQAS